MINSAPNKVFIVLGLSMLIMLTTCKSSATKKEISGTSVQQQIKKELGDDVLTDYNTSKSYALIQQIQIPEKIGSSIRFVVIRLSDTVVVHKGTYTRGYVKWIDDNTLEKLSLPGKVKADQDVDALRKMIKIDQAVPKL